MDICGTVHSCDRVIGDGATLRSRARHPSISQDLVTPGLLCWSHIIYGVTANYNTPLSPYQFDYLTMTTNKTACGSQLQVVYGMCFANCRIYNYVVWRVVDFLMQKPSGLRLTRVNAMLLIPFKSSVCFCGFDLKNIFTNTVSKSV